MCLEKESPEKLSFVHKESDRPSQFMSPVKSVRHKLTPRGCVNVVFAVRNNSTKNSDNRITVYVAKCCG